MKVPHSVVSRTSRDTTPRAYVSDAKAQGMAGLARGIGDVFKIGAEVAGQLKERQEKTERFSALREESDFESRQFQQLTEEQRASAPDDANFLERQAANYDREEAAFLNKMPAHLQDEFRARSGAIRERVVAASLDFQYKSQDAFYRKGVDDSYQKELTTLDPRTGGNPANLEAAKVKMAEKIAASDLSEEAKFELQSKINVGLETVVYRAKAVAAETAVGAVSAKDIGGAKALVRNKEGFRSTPYWDVNAWRIGFGSDTITKADGSIVKVTQDMTVSKADAERDLDRRVKEFQNGAARQVGQREWGALSPAAQAALTSVTYNYGSLPGSVVNAVKTGDTDAIAAAVENLQGHNGGINRDRRKSEAALIRQGGDVVPGREEDTLDSDPSVASVPYEDRLALRKDAEIQARAELAAQQAEATAAHEARLNTLYNGLNDGKMGVYEIDQARQSWLTDYDEINKAQGIIKDKLDKQEILIQAQEKLTQPGAIWSPGDEKDGKMQNALFNVRGAQAFQNKDQAYVQTGFIPMVQRTRDIPTDAIGMLTGMTRSNDPSMTQFGYTTLAALQDASPEAFNARVSDKLASDVQYWRDRKDVMKPEELDLALKGGLTQSERQGKKMLRIEATEFLVAKEKGIPKIRELMAEFVGDQGSWTSDAKQSTLPWAAAGLERDFRAAFVDSYEKYGNVEEAAKAAKQNIARTWATTNVGGQLQLMKYPPEKVGYKPVMGTYEWIDRQVRAETGIPEGEKFQLISDDQTRDEFLQSQSGGGAAPSYMIARVDSLGITRQIMDPDKPNIPLRLFFQPTARDIEIETQQYEFDQAQEEYEDFLQKNSGAAALSIEAGVEVDAEIKAEEEALRQRIEMLRPKPPEFTSPEDPGVDAMGNPTGL